MALLQVENLNKNFGSVSVANNLSFSLAHGEALGIIGPNGAGKTSLFNLIGGNLKADAGSVMLNGKNITTLSPDKRCHAGIARTYQIPQPFAKMTVFENCLVAAHFSGRVASGKINDTCAEILINTSLIKKANITAGSLTLLERKRLELARALAANPTLLLLDEIAGGLTEHEALALVESIKKIHATGTAIIWIEHIVHALVAVVSRLIVINFGGLVLEGEPRSVMDSPEVKSIYMGIEAA